MNSHLSSIQRPLGAPGRRSAQVSQSTDAPAAPLDFRWIVFQTSYRGNSFSASAMSLIVGAPHPRRSVHLPSLKVLHVLFALVFDSIIRRLLPNKRHDCRLIMLHSFVDGCA